MSFTRIAGLAAAGFAVIVATINVVLGATGWPPPVGTTPGEVAAYFADHSGLIGMDVSLTLVNIVLIVLFAAGAFATIWPLERDRGEAWSVVGLMGAAIMAAQFGVVVAIRAALTAGRDPAGGMWDLHNALFTAVGVGLGTIMIGFSVGGVRTGTVCRWHGGLGVVSGVLLIGSAALAPSTDALAAVALVGFVGWLVWLATFGVVLLRQGSVIPRQPRRGGGLVRPAG